MEKWAYIERIDKSVCNGKTLCLVTIICDTADSLPTPKSYWLPGSIALIADTHDCRILNTEGLWK